MCICICKVRGVGGYGALCWVSSQRITCSQDKGYYQFHHQRPTVANFKIKSWKDGHVIHSVKLCMLNKLRAKIFVESESALSCKHL